MPFPGIDPSRVQTRKIEKDDVTKQLDVMKTDDDKYVVYYTKTTVKRDEQGHWMDEERDVKVFVKDTNPLDKTDDKESKEEEVVTLMDAVKNFKF